MYGKLWSFEPFVAHRFTARAMLSGTLAMRRMVALTGQDEQVYNGAVYLTNWGIRRPPPPVALPRRSRLTPPDERLLSRPHDLLHLPGGLGSHHLGRLRPPPCHHCPQLTCALRTAPPRLMGGHLDGSAPHCLRFYVDSFRHLRGDDCVLLALRAPRSQRLSHGHSVLERPARMRHGSGLRYGPLDPAHGARLCRRVGPDGRAPAPRASDVGVRGDPRPLRRLLALQQLGSKRDCRWSGISKFESGLGV